MSDTTKWIKKSQKNIMFVDNTDHFIVDYLGIQSKISRPDETYQYYLISPTNGIDFIWYDSLNKYFIEKLPKEKDILAKLVRYIDKYSKQTSPMQQSPMQQSQMQQQFPQVFV